MKHKKLLIIFLFALMVSHVCSPLSAEETLSVESGERVDLIFSYTRQDTPKEDVAANVAVITREDIEKMPASNAAEVLQHVPGVYVDILGGLGAQATASIQGSDVRQVAVYQDGVPLNLLANPLTDLSYLPVNMIHRIEIYKGAASSVWGSSLGGVINIITREPNPSKPFSGEIQNSYGENETYRGYGLISGTTEKTGYLLSLTHEQSDGFIPYTAYRQDALYAKINQYFGDTSRLNFVYSYDEGHNEDPTPLFPEFWDDGFRRRTYQRLLYETSPSDSTSLTIEGRHQQFDGSIDDVFSDRREALFDYSEETWGISARASHSIKEFNRFGLGFDGDWGQYEFVSSTTDEADTGNWAFYANDTLNAGRFSFTAGARYDHNQEFGSEVSPSGGIVYRFSGFGALVRAQVAKGFSAPPVSWLNDPRFGNKDLEPETGVNYQVGMECKPLKFLDVEANIFRADVDNLIRFDFDSLRYENVDEATREGIDANVKAHFSDRLALSFGGTFVDVRDEETGDVVEDIPRILYTITASYKYKWTAHSIQGKYVYNNSSHPETRDRVFIFDYLVKVRLPLRGFYGVPSVFGAVHNLTDADYLVSFSAPQPGRWFEGGLTFEF